jgi:hypothetical protein
MRSGCYALVLVGLLAATAIADEPFHPPATQSERALNATLRAADNDRDQLDNLLAGRGDPHFKKTFDYSPRLTDALMKAIAAEETALVMKDCGGRYMEGDICGLDYSPITCGQDESNAYLYRTEQDDGHMAVISYGASKNQKPIATYRVTLVADRWKIDGVKCEEGAAFNFK